MQEENTNKVILDLERYNELYDVYKGITKSQTVIDLEEHIEGVEAINNSLTRHLTRITIDKLLSNEVDINLEKVNQGIIKKYQELEKVNEDIIKQNEELKKVNEELKKMSLFQFMKWKRKQKNPSKL